MLYEQEKNQTAKLADWKFLAVVAAGFVALAGAIFYAFAPQPGGQIPRYFLTAAAAKPLPETLDPDQSHNKDVAAAYKAAKAAPKFLRNSPAFVIATERMGTAACLTVSPPSMQPNATYV